MEFQVLNVTSLSQSMSQGSRLIAEESREKKNKKQDVDYYKATVSSGLNRATAQMKPQQMGQYT